MPRSKNVLDKIVTDLDLRKITYQKANKLKDQISLYRDTPVIYIKDKDFGFYLTIKNPLETKFTQNTIALFIQYHKSSISTVQTRHTPSLRPPLHPLNLVKVATPPHFRAFSSFLAFYSPRSNPHSLKNTTTQPHVNLTF